MTETVKSFLPFAAEVRKRLGDPLYDYMLGQARDNANGVDSNERAFAEYRLIPRVMRGQSAMQTQTAFFGQTLAGPIIAGAFAGDRVFHDDGLLPIAKACRSLALPMIVSEETVTPLSTICSAHDIVWLQLRAAGQRDRVRRLIDAAATDGALGIVLTVLAPVHPVQGLQPGGFSIGAEILRRGWSTIGATALGVEMLDAFPAWDWNDFKAACDHARSAGLPVLAKGILHADDAELAMKAGAAGIIASTIGGRQSSRWVPALEQLSAIGAKGGGTLIHDGGVRSGSDIVTALSLGAQLAIVVRPLICALVAGGESAVRDVLSRLRDETLAVASWCGVSDLTELDQSFVSRSNAGPLS